MAKSSGRNRYLRRGGGKKAGGGAAGGGGQLADAQAMLAQAQEKLASAVVEGSAGGGAVRVMMSGEHRVTAVVIDPDVVDLDEADREMLEELIVAAVSDAAERVAELQADSFGAVTGGLNIPGLG
jgi:nucleoid-associated protein EbfC